MDVRARRRMVIRHRQLRQQGKSTGEGANVNSDNDNNDESSSGEKENAKGGESPVTTIRSSSPVAGTRMRIGGSQRSSFQQFPGTYESREPSPEPLRETSHKYSNPSPRSRTMESEQGFKKQGFSIADVFQKDLDEDLAELPSLSMSEGTTPSMSISMSDEPLKFTMSDGPSTEPRDLGTSSPYQNDNTTKHATGSSTSSPLPSPISGLTVKKYERDPSPFDEQESLRKQERERIMRLMNGLDELLVETPPANKSNKTPFAESDDQVTVKHNGESTDIAKTEEEKMKIRSLMQGLDLLLVDTPPSSGKAASSFKDDSGDKEKRAIPALQTVTSEQTTILAGVTAKNQSSEFLSPESSKAPNKAYQYTIEENQPEGSISATSSSLEENFKSMIAARCSEDQYESLNNNENQSEGSEGSGHRVVKDPSGDFLAKKPCPSGVKQSSSSGTMHHITMSYTTDTFPSTSQSSHRSQSSYSQMTYSSSQQDVPDEEALHAFRNRIFSSTTSQDHSHSQRERASEGQESYTDSKGSARDELQESQHYQEESRNRDREYDSQGASDGQESYTDKASARDELQERHQYQEDPRNKDREYDSSDNTRNDGNTLSKVRPDFASRENSYEATHTSSTMETENSSGQDSNPRFSLQQDGYQDMQSSNFAPKQHPLNDQALTETGHIMTMSNGGIAFPTGAAQKQYQQVPNQNGMNPDHAQHESEQMMQRGRLGPASQGETQRVHGQLQQNQWTSLDKRQNPMQYEGNLGIEENNHTQISTTGSVPNGQNMNKPQYGGLPQSNPHHHHQASMHIRSTGSSPGPQGSMGYSQGHYTHTRSNSATSYHQGYEDAKHHPGPFQNDESRHQTSLPPHQAPAAQQRFESRPSSPTTNYYNNMMDQGAFSSRPTRSMVPPQPYNRHAASLEVRTAATAPSPQAASARKVLARSVESQEAQSHHRIRSQNSAATPLAKTKHSRYHRGGKFRQDQQEYNRASPTPKCKTLEEKLEEMKAQRREQSASKKSPQADDATVATTTFTAGTEATTAVSAGTPDRECNQTETFSSCGSSDESDFDAEYEEENMGSAFLQNAMGMFESIVIPNFTNCVATTKGVYDQVQTKAERACIKPPPGPKKKKGKKKKGDKRRKSTSGINTTSLVRSSEQKMYTCGDDDPTRVIMMKDSKTGLPYF